LRAPEIASPTHPSELSPIQDPTLHLEIGTPHTLNAAARPKFIVSDPDELLGIAQYPEPVRVLLAQHTAELQNVLPPPSSPEASSDSAPNAEPGQPDLDSWRAEVTARLSRYRARRRPREPRYPSLRLKFEMPPARISAAPEISESTTAPVSSSAPLTCQALAMNPVEPAEEEEISPAPAPPIEIAPEPVEPSRGVLAKVLEFPRWSCAPPVPLNDLADPIVERPRILEVPEVVPPPPAMGGITIEDAQAPEPERRPGIDMPLRTAPLGLRVWAVALDWFIVLSASAMFGYLFYRVVGTEPPLWELIGMGVGLPVIFWAAYQYLFTVYCGTTPGLQAAHLRISRFDGSPVNQRARRLRVLCGLLSGISLGMGYAWQFLDEDRLCWHERVTRTYLAPPS
jgi:uncharacterized RDD family membrane protein YckC